MANTYTQIHIHTIFAVKKRTGLIQKEWKDDFGDKNIYISADTHKQTEFNHLPSGIAYNVSVFAINRAGSGPAATSQKVIPQ